jgi:hypothetical protein
LEEVEVPPVDQGDVDRRPPERPRRTQPAEPAADDDNPVSWLAAA